MTPTDTPLSTPPGTPIARWQPHWQQPLEPDEAGDYVRYEDHQAALARAEAAEGELRGSEDRLLIEMDHAKSLQAALTETQAELNRALAQIEGMDQEADRAHARYITQTDDHARWAAKAAWNGAIEAAASILIECGSKQLWTLPCKWQDAIRAMTVTERPAAAPAPNAVRPLLWEGAGAELRCPAFGLFTFYKIGGEPGDWSLMMPGETRYEFVTGFKTQSEAKAAAQADFDARIRAALTTAQPPAAPLDRPSES